jgi:hypothetical protein
VEQSLLNKGFHGYLLMQIPSIAFNEGKVVLNVSLFKQAQLRLFIHL